MRKPRRNFIQRVLKRTMDILLSSVALVILTPVIAVITVSILSKLGRPVLFRQRRPGLKGRPFDLIKFRSMSNDRDSAGVVKCDADRLSTFGRFLRSTSLDELPEFWNVLRGDMSLVGPRPLLMQYRELYTSEQARRHEVRPGLTGLAQIKGRNALSWEDRFTFDVWYVDNWTICLDVKILLATILLVLRRRGVAAEGSETMPEFTGSEELVKFRADFDDVSERSHRST